MNERAIPSFGGLVFGGADLKNGWYRSVVAGVEGINDSDGGWGLNLTFSVDGVEDVDVFRNFYIGDNHPDIRDYSIWEMDTLARAADRVFTCPDDILGASVMVKIRINCDGTPYITKWKALR